MGAIWLFVPCMLLAIFFHPSMNKVPTLNRASTQLNKTQSQFLTKKQNDKRKQK